MNRYLLIRHKVKDFSTWKQGYDAHLSNRTEAGLTEEYLLRADADPNEVILLFEVQDLSRAKAFSEAADLRERMHELGVVDKPDLYFLSG